MIRELTLPDAVYVCNNMRRVDRDEVFATRWDDDIDALTVEMYNAPGPKWCIAKANGTPVVIGGVAFHLPKVGTAWMVATDEFDCVAIETTRFVKGMFRQLLKETLHRVFANSAQFHASGHRWLEAIGFHRESVMRKLGRNGEDFYCYAMVRD